MLNFSANLGAGDSAKESVKVAPDISAAPVSIPFLKKVRRSIVYFFIALLLSIPVEPDRNYKLLYGAFYLSKHLLWGEFVSYDLIKILSQNSFILFRILILPQKESHQIR